MVPIPRCATSSRCRVLCRHSSRYPLQLSSLQALPRPAGTMFHSTVPSRYLSPAVLLAPGTAASRSAPASLLPLSAASWIEHPKILFLYTSSPISSYLCMGPFLPSSHPSLCLPPHHWGSRCSAAHPLLPVLFGSECNPFDAQSSGAPSIAPFLSEGFWELAAEP